MEQASQPKTESRHRFFAVVASHCFFRTRIGGKSFCRGMQFGFVRSLLLQLLNAPGIHTDDSRND